MCYVAWHPFPGFGGPFPNIGIVSLMYILLGISVMYLVYGRKKDPLQTHADRMRKIRGVVNLYFWICILMSVLLSLSVAQKLLDLETWGPFAGTVFSLFSRFSFFLACPRCDTSQKRMGLVPTRFVEPPNS